MLKSWAVITPDSEERRIAIFKDNKLRLLMTLAGFERLGIDEEPNATWIISSSISARDLEETQRIIEHHLKNPTYEYGDENPVSAKDMLRRVSAAKTRRAEYDDDSDGGAIVSNDEEEFLFPAGGPTSRNRKSALKDLKEKRKRRTVTSDDEGVGMDDETRALRREARRAADLERRRKIKSEKFVRDSDEESDEELDRGFFAREEEMRKGQAGKVLEAFKAGRVTTIIEGRKRKSIDGDEGQRKRSKLDSGLSDSDIGISSDSDSLSPEPRRADASSASDKESSETPLSSPRIDSPQQKPKLIGRTLASPKEKTRLVGRRLDSSQERFRDKTSALTLLDGEGEGRDKIQDVVQDETEDSLDEDVPSAPTARRRGRAVLVDDSDDE